MARLCIFAVSQTAYVKIRRQASGAVTVMTMIVGLGTDIVEILRFERICSRFGQRFLEKIFTGEEIRAMSNPSTATLAGRFAAKEAAVKALGTGFAQGIGPRQIETGKNSLGAPRLTFLGPAAERARTLGVARSLLSISHDRTAAVAVVVLEA